MTKLFAWTEHRFVNCDICGLPEECIFVGEGIFDAKPMCKGCFHREAVKHKHQIECVDAFCGTCKFRQYKNSNCTTCFISGVETGDFTYYEPSEAQRLHNSNVKLIASAQKLEEENKQLKHRLQVETERANEHVADCKAAEEKVAELEAQLAKEQDPELILHDLRADMHNFELVIDTNPFLRTLAIWGLELLSQHNAPNHLALTLRSGEEPLSIVIERPEGQTTAEKIASLTSALKEFALEDNLELKPMDEWCEEDGNVLCWRLPVEEPPQVTSPVCSDWQNNYYSHFSKLPYVWKHRDYKELCEQHEELCAKQFPIHSTDSEWRTSVPWKFAQQYEHQMRKNHYQTMERLAERGGLSAKELYACLTFSEWRYIHHSDEECRALVDNMLKEQGYE